MSTNERKVVVDIRTMPSGEGLPLPKYHTCGAAGLDLTAAVSEPIILGPGKHALVPCGFSMRVPDGYVADIRTRSGLALKHSVVVLNSPGTIDSDYRGEVGALLFNGGTEEFVIHRGDRVAQLVLLPSPTVVWNIVESLPGTERNGGGFGHTGKR